ncbi:MAG: DUF349 domain-containing protein [Rikenellaceae bacterium]|jgi:hypothetical protein|nr:DUF349 domain-containing protein [Rikenellaceae bacterium]
MATTKSSPSQTEEQIGQADTTLHPQPAVEQAATVVEQATVAAETALEAADAETAGEAAREAPEAAADAVQEAVEIPEEIQEEAVEDAAEETDEKAPDGVAEVSGEASDEVFEISGDAAEISGDAVAPKKPRPRVKKVVPASEGAAIEAIAEAPSVGFVAQDAAELPEPEATDPYEESEGHEEDAAPIHDLAGKSKRQLVDLFEALMAEKPVQSFRRDTDAIKVAFYKQHRADVEAIRRRFIEDGGTEEEFAAPVDADEQRLKQIFAEYRKRRDEHLAGLEQRKEESLARKHKIIEELKELIASGETLNHTFNTFRELQQRWRDSGPVPQALTKDVWETYNHHVEQFYNYIKINKELRDLDLRRNYEAKVKLCEEAEALLLEPSIVAAFNRLQKLHDEWRDVGPVAAEFKEAVWDRFREASSRINKLHQEHFEKLKEEQKRNYDLKLELCIKTEELAEGLYTSRKEWSKASDRLTGIQKIWKTIGFAPKKENTRIYDRFRRACDRFFENKRNFYLGAKDEMEVNLQLKTELCEMVEAIRNSEEWSKATDEIIAIQKRWKEIGPVARRYSDPIWKRFRAACDEFFERKAQQFSSVGATQEENLRRKREMLEEMSRAVNEKASELTFDAVKNFQRTWGEIGFVPIKAKDAVAKEYKAVMDKMFELIRGSVGEWALSNFRSKISDIRTGGENRLRQERDRIYNKVRQLEADIALLENNIGFFAKSKNSEAIVRDVRTKIDRAREEMAREIEKIRMIDKNE